MTQPTGSKSTPWLAACGCGCVALIVAFVALGWLGTSFVRRTTAGFESAVEVRQDLEERFGTTESYVPSSDGALPPERMEAFLAVREATGEARERLTAAWADIPLSPSAARELENQSFVEKMQSTYKITRAGLGLGREMGKFFEARNQAMADAGIGLGEYTYAYALAYYAWLGHPPDEGPETASGDDGFGPGMGNAFLGRVRDELLAMLRNQLEALPPDTPEAWRQALTDEIARVEDDRDRLPWQDGLPSPVAESFEPYRDRLEATYSPATNAFELGRNSKRGRFSITAE